MLKSRIIGQDAAVDALVGALCRARVGLKDPSRPAASMLLVGPTGVGKTQLIKVLAEQYFGTQVCSLAGCCAYIVLYIHSVVHAQLETQKECCSWCCGWWEQPLLSTSGSSCPRYLNTNPGT